MSFKRPYIQIYHSGLGRSKASRMMESIAELWSEGKHTDVTLLVGGGIASGGGESGHIERLPAHKIVLISGSDYMRALLESDRFADSTSGTLELPDVSPTGARMLLEWFYKGRVSSDSFEDAIHCLSAALRLQCLDVAAQVEKELIKKLDASNCLACWDLAEDLQLSAVSKGQRESEETSWEVKQLFDEKGLSKMSRAKLLHNFTAVARTEGFVELSFDRLLDILSDDNLIVEKEEDLFDILVKWIKAQKEDPSERSVGELFSCLRYGVMEQAFIDDAVAKEKIFSDNAEAKEIAKKGRDDLKKEKETKQTMQRLKKVQSWEMLTKLREEYGHVRVTTDQEELRSEYTAPGGGLVECMRMEDWDEYSDMCGPKETPKGRWMGVYLDLEEVTFDPNVHCIRLREEYNNTWRFPYQVLYQPPRHVVTNNDDWQM